MEGPRRNIPHLIMKVKTRVKLLCWNARKI